MPRIPLEPSSLAGSIEENRVLRFVLLFRKRRHLPQRLLRLVEVLAGDLYCGQSHEGNTGFASRASALRNSGSARSGWLDNRYNSPRATAASGDFGALTAAFLSTSSAPFRSFRLSFSRASWIEERRLVGNLCNASSRRLLASSILPRRHSASARVSVASILSGDAVSTDSRRPTASRSMSWFWLVVISSANFNCAPACFGFSSVALRSALIPFGALPDARNARPS